MRWKLIAGNVGVLLLVSLLAFWMVRDQVHSALARDADPSVQRNVGLFAAVRTAEGDRYVNLVGTGAQRADLHAVFANATTSEQQAAAFQFAERYSLELASMHPPQRPRKADMVAVTTLDGHVLARNVEASQDRNRALASEYEVVASVLQSGRAERDFLKYDGQKWYDVVVAPVNAADGTRQGALLVGYEISDSIAADDKARLGADVGLLIRDANNQFALHSLSFGTQADKDALARWANSPESGLAQLFTTDNPAPVRTVQVNGTAWRVSAEALPGIHRPTHAGASRPGFLVLRNQSIDDEVAMGTVLPILWLLIVGLVLLLLYNVLVANYFLRPIEAIEEGLLRLINGDRDYRIDVQHAELGGIVFRLNQLVSELTGASEDADESGRIAQPGPRAGDMSFPPPVAPGPSAVAPRTAAVALPKIDTTSYRPDNAADVALVQSLGAEPDGAYYERLHREVLDARAQLGLGSDHTPHEQFVASVRAAEQDLARQGRLAVVRFAVAVANGEVIFRAIPVR